MSTIGTTTAARVGGWLALGAAATLGAQTPSVTRADLVPAYRAVDQAYAAVLPPPGPERAAINRAFDRATLRFFSGDLAATQRAILDVRQMLARTPLDTMARRTPLQRYAVQVAPFAWPAIAERPSSAPRTAADSARLAARRRAQATAAQRRTDSLSITIRPLAVDTARRDSIEVRLEIVPRSGGPSVSRTLRWPAAQRSPVPLALAPWELRTLLPGRYHVRLIATTPGVADSSLAADFAIVPVALDAVRGQFERDFAMLAPAPDSVRWTRALFAERLALVNPTPTDDETAVRLQDPNVVVTQLRTELDALIAQRNPYANRAGDFWWRLTAPSAVAGAPPATMPVRISAAPAVATSATPVPLVIALHGAGIDENGFADGYGDGRLLREAATRGMLVATPSTIAVQRAPALLDTLIATLARSYPVDRSRIYLIGHSMGAGATTALVQRAGHPFAAAVAIAGGGPVASATGVPPMRFIGAALDPVIPAARVKQAAEGARAAGVRAEYLEVPDVGHTMVVTHVLGEVLDWLLTQRRAP